MVKPFIKFLSDSKMTIFSGICLLTSLAFMFFKIKFIFDPAWLTVLISGTPIVFKAINKLFFNKRITSPLLITLAMFASIAINELFAAGEVALIIAIGELLEDMTIDKAKRGLEHLLELKPSSGRKISANGTEKIVSLSEIKEGDILRVLAGESIPVDGIIVNGTTSVNQATLTGESLPIDKTIGDMVMAGTVNQFGVIEIKVLTVQNTYLQKMINLVKEAEDKKAPKEKIIDKWATILIPTALAIAILTYIFTGITIRAVTVLVVFCPCALVLATPTSIIAAIGQAAKNGVLIKSGAALEEMGYIDTFIFDKTGTLTAGKIEVAEIISMTPKITKDQILSLTYGIEKFSEHTLAKAIINKAQQNDISPAKVKDFQIKAGEGVCGKVDNKLLLVGNLKFIQNHHIDISDDIMKKIEHYSTKGHALVFVALDNDLIGLITLSDILRPETIETIKELHQQESTTLLLTGDNSFSANNLAQTVGIQQVYSDLLPTDKVQKITDLSQNNHSVCMIGDGINDAPALKTANIGIAMGHIGSDISIDAADIVLINDNLKSLPYLKKLSLQTIKTININILISMTLNCLGIVLSIYGILIPITGAILHNMGSVIVVLNASRLYDKKI